MHFNSPKPYNNPIPQATTTRWHTKEGSFINRSLLALGGVIAKLAEGNAAHVPFRDSKLTRVLASSLTGSGARIAVVCTVTPGSAQAEETHNTLKFATRAKKARRPRPFIDTQQRRLFLGCGRQPCLAHGWALLHGCPVLRD